MVLDNNNKNHLCKVIINNNNGNFYSALPIKNFTALGMYKSNTNNSNITQTHTHTHAHTHTNRHTHSHTSSFKNYMLPNTHAKRLKIKPLELHLHFLSLSLSLLAHTQVQVTCSFTGGKVGWAVEHTEKFKESGSYTERNSVVLSWVLNWPICSLFYCFISRDNYHTQSLQLLEEARPDCRCVKSG